MKAKLLVFTVCHFFIFGCSISQDRASVYTMSNEISDNLDIRAVASIFGESTNLSDFERRLNDPRLQISNLDLNEDLQVDYLRVIESVEHNTHVVIIQAVLGRDQFQDVATIDIEKDRYNNIRVQFIGDEYMYGHNYIYEPMYRTTPVIYASFWVNNYRPYCSTWNWGYYPTYYYAWRPYSTHRYYSNINNCINYRNTYRYVSYRNSVRAPKLCKPKHHNAFEKRHPHYAYQRQDANPTYNRYENRNNRISYQNENSQKTNYSYNNNEKRQYNNFSNENELRNRADRYTNSNINQNNQQRERRATVLESKTPYSYNNTQDSRISKQENNRQQFSNRKNEDANQKWDNENSRTGRRINNNENQKTRTYDINNSIKNNRI